MKKIIIILGLMLITLLFGCNDFPTENDEIEYIEIEDTYTYNQHCFYNNYIIDIVDEMFINNCYAVRYNTLNIETYKGDIIKESINYINITPEDYFAKQNIFCGEITTRGTLYCLKDFSQCLDINGNICEIYNTTQLFPNICTFELWCNDRYIGKYNMGNLDQKNVVYAKLPSYPRQSVNGVDSIICILKKNNCIGE